MFERMTERSRQVIVLAQEEQRKAGDRIHTGYILLGIMREQDGLGCTALRNLGLTDVDLVRERVRASGTVEFVEEKILQKAAIEKTSAFSELAKKVIELSLREALSLGHNYIGTEHLLLGIARMAEGVATEALAEAGIDSDKIRDEVIRLLTADWRRKQGAKPKVKEKVEEKSKAEPSPEASDPERIAEIAREAIVAGGRLASALVSAVGSIYAAEQLGRDQIRRVVVDTIMKSSRGTDESKADWAKRIADDVCELL